MHFVVSVQLKTGGTTSLTICILIYKVFLCISKVDRVELRHDAFLNIHTYLRQIQAFWSINSLIALAAKAIIAVLPLPDFPCITKGYWLGPLTYSSISFK